MEKIIGKEVRILWMVEKLTLLSAGFFFLFFAACSATISLRSSRSYTKNSAYIGYKHRSDHGNDNQLTLGFWGANNLVNLLPNGDFGIGTETPTAKLHINGGAWNTNMILQGGGAESAELTAGLCSAVSWPFALNELRPPPLVLGLRPLRSREAVAVPTSPCRSSCN